MSATPAHVPRHRTKSADWAGTTVYGLIATLVVTGTLLLRPDVDPVSAASDVLAGAGALWLAHALERVVADWARGDETVHLRMVLRRMRRSWPILSASLPATGILLIAAVVSMSTKQALWVSVGVNVASLGGIGVWIAIGKTGSPIRSSGYAAILVGVGVAITLLEVAAHFI